MADFISTSPEFSHEPLTPKVEVVSWVPENIDNKTKNILIDTKNKTAVILVSAETRQQSKELNDEFKKQFIEKLKHLPDYEWSKVKVAIEKWTIEIKKTKTIQYKYWWLELSIDSKYAIYEKWWNLIYIVNNHWEKYINIDKLRNWFSNAFLQTWLDLNWINQVKEWEKYNLYKWNKKIEIWSDEYEYYIIIASDISIQIANKINDSVKKDWL